MYKFGEAEQSGGMLSEDEKHCLGCCNFWLLESWRANRYVSDIVKVIVDG